MIPFGIHQDRSTSSPSGTGGTRAGRGRTLARLLRVLGWRTEGSVVTEFALVAPALLALITMTMEFGMMMFTSSLMEGALREASRYGVTGQGGATQEERLVEIMAIIQERTIGLVDMDQADVKILVYDSFGDIGRGEAFVDGNGNGTYDLGETFQDENGNGVWDRDVGTSGSGTARDIVVYRMTYHWNLLTPFAGTFIGDENGQVTLSASIAVRNEPWEDAPI
jgi:Flp pilus assembly protein TadG